MLNEVRVLVLSPFNYVYGSKEISYWCGDFFYLNPSSNEDDLEELKFILDSSYLWKGWIYLEENIKEDYKNKRGLFAPKVTPTELPTPVEIIEEVTETEEANPQVEVVEETLEVEESKSKKPSNKSKSPASDK